ncbi:MAG: hypothetical protein ABIB79_04885 [archaeon]
MKMKGLMFVLVFLFFVNIMSAATLTVSVKDNQGNPIPEAYIVAGQGFGVSPIDYNRGEYEEVMFGSSFYVTTHDTGNISIINMDGGDYSIIVTKANYEPKSVDVSVSSGENIIDISLSTTTKGIKTFFITLDRYFGEPIPNAKLEIDGESYFTDTTGAVDIELEQGTYSHFISKEGYRNSSGTTSFSAGGINKRRIILREEYSEPACTESWTCNAWSFCTNNQQTRYCSDSNSCGTTSNKPSTSQSCIPDCTESWSCTEWSSCVGVIQIRTCTDSNNCRTTENKPAINQTCTPGKCSENWDCTNWGECTDTKKTRTCNDLNNCGTVVNKPSTSKSCTRASTDFEEQTPFQFDIPGCPQITRPNCPRGSYIENDEDENRCEVRHRCETRLSNGRNAEIKVMPETASERARERLGELDFEVELVEVGKGDETKIIYEVKAKKQGRFLGLFKIRGEVVADIDSETGEIIRTKKPWWAFLAWGI